MKDMRIKIIGIYFGKVPSYFQLWLDSIAANPRFDWLLYTDVDLSVYNVPQNLHVHKVSFESVRQLIKFKLGYEPDLDIPWDLCKFKPVYGAIFENDLKDADYWGWTDFDVIYGDLSPIYAACERGYDKIMPLGHLSCVKNDAKLMAGIIADPLVARVLSKGSQKVDLTCFDELAFPLQILPRLKARQYNDIPFAQFHCRYGHFRLAGAEALSDRVDKLAKKKQIGFPCIVTWGEGRLIAWFAMPDKTVKAVECVYIHFFRREMSSRINSFEKRKSYLIVPNDIREYDGHNLSWREIVWLDRPRIHWRYFAVRLTPKRIIKKLCEVFAPKR